MNNSLLLNLSQILLEKSIILSTAESCTGGLIASYLTALPGSSNWFEMGFVTYSNQAKMQLLKVPALTIKTYGAVSEETVLAMAEGALHESDADIALSISGIAGPDGATKKYAVGSVWMAIVSKNHRQSFLQHFSGNRTQIRTDASEFAIQALIEFIQNNHS